MKVLMVASEAVPYAKTGGLADVVGVLPRFLERRGHDVRLVLPLYASVDKSVFSLEPLPHPLDVPMGELGTMRAQVYVGQLPHSQVKVYFIERNDYFQRHNLYTDEAGNGFLDNDRRFVFLSRAAMELTFMLHWFPNLVHCNDWHTAAIPVFLNTHYRDTPLGNAASLLTLHNLQHQGRYYSGLMNVLDVGWEHFNHLGLEWYDEVNLLKGGIYHSTLLNAVSDGYAREIKTPAFGHGLEGVLGDRASVLRGILNGIDYMEWSPETDPFIEAHYSETDLSGKSSCKIALQREMGLPQREVPLIGIVSRLVHQKGLDVLAATLDRLLSQLDVQMVLLGTGEEWAHDFFPQVAERYPTRFACTIGYDNPLAHRIEAGSDFFLMPSRFEPCGLNQLYSLRYGTLPIVHAVGGLDDTVEQYDPRTLQGTGFKFYQLDENSLLDTLRWAVHTWQHRKDALYVLIRRAMRARFSWDDSARQYEALYYEAVQRRGAS